MRDHYDWHLEKFILDYKNLYRSYPDPTAIMYCVDKENGIHHFSIDLDDPNFTDFVFNRLSLIFLVKGVKHYVLALHDYSIYKSNKVKVLSFISVDRNKKKHVMFEIGRVNNKIVFDKILDTRIDPNIYGDVINLLPKKDSQPTQKDIKRVKKYLEGY